MIYSSIYKRNNFALTVKIFIFMKQVQVMFTTLTKPNTNYYFFDIITNNGSYMIMVQL